MVRKSFDPDLSSAAAVRRFIRSQAELPADAQVDVIVLLANELAVNAIAHTKQPFDVTVSIKGVCVEVSVDDKDSAPLPPPGTPSPDDPTGRGLALVEAASDAWGWHPTPSGKRVWFRLCGLRA